MKKLLYFTFFMKYQKSPFSLRNIVNLWGTLYLITNPK